MHTTVHVGPLKNLEAYVHESGTAGRGGSPSKAIILYHGLMINVENDIKYVTSSTCRRAVLTQLLGIDLHNGSKPHHSCCDVCALMCKCTGDNGDVKDTSNFPKKDMNDGKVYLTQRENTEEKRNEVKVPLK